MLYTKIDELIAKAMKDREPVRANVLRMIKSELHFAETRDNPKERIVITDATELEFLKKMAANYEENIKIQKERGLVNDVEKNEKELSILREFLPVESSDDDVRAYAEEVVKEMKEQNGSVSMKDTRIVIGKVSEKHNSQHIGKIVSEVIKSYQ